MRRNVHQSNRNFLTRRVVLTAVLAIAMPFVILACSQQPEKSSPATDKVSDTATPAIGGAAMKAYKDPETGKLGAPPETASTPEPSEAIKNMTSTSSEGLEEKPAPSGGTMVDLKGRFQSHENAKKDPGKASKPASGSTGASNRKAYKDPVTGKLGAPPDTASISESSEAMQSATSTSSEGLEEEPAPGGGTMVDLKGRFGSSITATKDKSGKITKSHTPNSQHN